MLSAKVTRPHVRANRPQPEVSISSVPVSEGIEIRQGCQFVSSLFTEQASGEGGEEGRGSSGWSVQPKGLEPN